ncbi:MAG: MATE family efflux transporter [Anaerolineales bacterium]
MTSKVVVKSRAQKDLVSGVLPCQILELALPSIAEQALFSTMGPLDAFWMGSVSEMALAAVIMGTTLRVVLISPMMGLLAEGMAVVARHCGADDVCRADHATMQAMLLIVFFVIALAVLGQIMGPTFLRWMGARGFCAMPRPIFASSLQGCTLWRRSPLNRATDGGVSPIVIDMGSLWLVQFPLSWLLSRRGWGIQDSGWD